MPTATHDSTLPSGSVEVPCATNMIGATAPVPGPIGCTTMANELGHWLIYGLKDRMSGRWYVGLTIRSLDARIAAHIAQARRGRRLRPGGLLEFLRDAGVTMATVYYRFAVQVLDRAATRQEARVRETAWIATLGARGAVRLQPDAGGRAGWTLQLPPGPGHDPRWPEGICLDWSGGVRPEQPCKSRRWCVAEAIDGARAPGHRVDSGGGAGLRAPP